MAERKQYRLVFGGNPLEAPKNFYKKLYNDNKLGHGVLLSGTISLLGLLVIFYLIVPFIVAAVAKHETQLKVGNDLWRIWSNLTVPIYFKFYVFNITNPDEILRGEKPKFKEMGPYVYEEKRRKKIIERNEEEDTILYNETYHYIFRPDLSHGAVDDEVTIFNIPYISLSTILSRYVNIISNIPMRWLESQGESLFSRKVKVGQIMFDGMEVNKVYSPLINLAPLGIPEEFVGDTFALFNRWNGSTHQWKIKAGIKDSSKLGNIVSMDGKDRLSYWGHNSLPPSEQDYCNRINGSDGTLNPPMVTKDRKLYVFNHLLCRSVYLKYSHEVETFGIDAYRFTITKDLFASPDKNPDNECFCGKPGGSLNQECIDGGYRIFSCHSDAPIVISRPHFVDGDLQYQNFEGIDSDPKKYFSYADVEPVSGMLIKANLKVQANIELQPLKGLEAFNKFPHGVFPLVWLDLQAELDEETGDLLRHKLFPLVIVNVAKWALISVTVLLVSIGVCIAATCRSKKLIEANNDLRTREELLRSNNNNT